MQGHLEARIPAHISCRPIVSPNDANAGCFVICAEHDLRRSFGSAHSVAHAACVEHNRQHHPNRRAQGPKLLSLIYESMATSEVTEENLIEILGQARASNSAIGVTGMLLAENGWFLQALEGPAFIVNDLMATIRADPRHGHVRVLASEPITERRFPDWAMARGHIGEVEALPLAQYYEALLMVRGEPTVLEPGSDPRGE